MTRDEILGYFACQSDATDPREHAPLFHGLSGDVGALCRTIQGLLIHVAWAGSYGVEVPDARWAEVQVHRVSERLGDIRSVDDRPLEVARPADGRMLCTCRDFVLMLCGILRHRGIPARVRCGFATYLRPGHHEDHWICEYWNAHEERWVMVDAQLDEVQRNHLGIGFDTTDLPPGRFLTAGRAWHMCRAGEADPATFGNGRTTGLWFMSVNVVRDLLALAKREASPWDTWRLGRARGERLSDEAVALGDRLAALAESGDDRFGEACLVAENERGACVPPWL